MPSNPGAISPCAVRRHEREIQITSAHRRWIRPRPTRELMLWRPEDWRPGDMSPSGQMTASLHLSDAALLIIPLHPSILSLRPSFLLFPPSSVLPLHRLVQPSSYAFLDLFSVCPWLLMTSFRFCYNVLFRNEGRCRLDPTRTKSPHASSLIPLPA